MSLSAPQQQALVRLVERHDRIRGVDASVPAAKEWLHFCVVAGDVSLLANFSVMQDLRPAAAERSSVCRVVALAHDERGWHGDVAAVDVTNAELKMGGISARMGASSVEFRDGKFELVLDVEGGGLRAELTLEPRTMPIVRRPFVSNPMSWTIVPRLHARGTLLVNARSYEVDAPAYHDHNWGTWCWGQDCVWQWGFGLPTSEACPWSVTFVRLSDRKHLKAVGHELILTRNELIFRVFRGHEVEFRYAGGRPARATTKVPAVMALLAPEANTEVPVEWEIAAQRGAESLRCRVFVESVAQLIVPNESNFGLTILNECVARIVVEGRVGGELVEFEGKSVLEYLTVQPE